MNNLLENSIPLTLLIPCIVLLYLLPTIIALVFNRKHKKQIFFANLPAGFVWTLWFGVLIWAITGTKKNTKESVGKSGA